MTFIKFLDDLVRIAYNRSIFIDIDDPLTEITFVAEGHLVRLPANTKPILKSSLKKGIKATGTGCCFWCGVILAPVGSGLDSSSDATLNDTTCVGCSTTRLHNRLGGYRSRAKKLRTYSKLTKVDMVKVVMASNGKCQKCGVQCDAVIPEDGSHKRKTNDMTIDHDYPLCLGGMNIPQNLVILCTGCHRKKDQWINIQTT